MRLATDEEAIQVPIAGLFRIYAARSSVAGVNRSSSLAAMVARIPRGLQERAARLVAIFIRPVWRVPPAIVPLRCEIVAKDGETQTIEHDYGIRFYGLPSGYEFSSLIGIVLDVSRGDSGLNPQSRAALHELAAPLHIQVFSTPT